jgi:hypothetical protein
MIVTAAIVVTDVTAAKVLEQNRTGEEEETTNFEVLF